MAPPPPAIRIPPPPSSLHAAQSPLPELPQELLISAFIGRSERDALDSFVLAGAGASGSQGGGVQVEDVLNELIPDG